MRWKVLGDPVGLVCVCTGGQKLLRGDNFNGCGFGEDHPVRKNSDGRTLADLLKLGTEMF